MWLECTYESRITVDITKRNRKTIPYIRTANGKCTLPKLSSCASNGDGRGSIRSEMTSLWVCRVSEIGRTMFCKIWCIIVLNITRCLTGSQCSCCSAGLMCARRSRLGKRRAAVFCTRCSGTSLHAGMTDNDRRNLVGFVQFGVLLWPAGRSGLVVARLPAAREVPGSNLQCGQVSVFQAKSLR